MGLTLTKTRTFDAAHHLPNLPAHHPCSRVHGHTYTVTVEVGRRIPDLNGVGFVMDLGELDDRFKDTLRKLDHYDLNEVVHKRDTSMENVAVWIVEDLQRRLPHEVKIVSLVLAEGSHGYVTWRP